MDYQNETIFSRLGTGSFVVISLVEILKLCFSVLRISLTSYHLSYPFLCFETCSNQSVKGGIGDVMAGDMIASYLPQQLMNPTRPIWLWLA